MDDFEHLDHYEILGIGRSVSSDEIKLAYRQQMRRYHPDRFASAPSSSLSERSLKPEGWCYTGRYETQLQNGGLRSDAGRAGAAG